MKATVLLALVFQASAFSTTVHSGVPVKVRVVHYSPGLMERVRQIRIRQGYHIPTNVHGYASRPSCATIGQTFWLSVNGGRPRKYAQVDCSQYRDRARHERVNQVELDWPSAVVTGLVRDGHGTGVMWK